MKWLEENDHRDGPAWYIEGRDGGGVGITRAGCGGRVWVDRAVAGASYRLPHLTEMGLRELAFVCRHLAETSRLPGHVYVGDETDGT